MKVTLAGTGGMIPLPYRWLVSCHIHHNGKYFLIDCGEGTQIALEEAGINPGRIDVLMITHFHADHIMGLPGLLMAMANKGKKSKLTLIGPKQLHAVGSALCVVCPPMPYDIEVIEMEGGGLIKLELDPSAAPNTVKNFKYLADKGFVGDLHFRHHQRAVSVRGKLYKHEVVFLS